MRRFAFAFLLALSAPVCAAAPLFDTFKTLCIDTGADPAAVKKAAAAMGGKPGETFHDVDPTISSTMTFQNWKVGKDFKVKTGTEFTAASRNIPAEHTAFCTLLTHSLRDKAGIARLHQWAGIPSAGMANDALYSFQDLGGHHVPMPKDRDAFFRAQATGRTWHFSVLDEENGAMVQLTHYLPR